MGDKRAATELAGFFAGEYQNMVRYLKRRARDLNVMEAEDVIGDLMVNLIARVDLTAGVENLAAYIYRSLERRLLDWLRKRKRVISLDGAGDGGIPWRDLLAGRNDAEREAINREARRRIIAALDALPPKQRAVWLANELEGYTFQELSTMWDEPLGTLLARKHRATEALR